MRLPSFDARSARRPAGAGALLLLAGCATVWVGKYQLLKDNWERDSEELKNRGAFELKCEPKDLSLTVLAVVYPGKGPNQPKQVGVEGCGHRAVYVTSDHGWLLNSSDLSPNPQYAPK